MEAELKFEKENISGIAVVGSYLIDAAKRLGIDITDDCGRLGLCDSCVVTVKSGAEFLTELTKAETEVLSAERRGRGERLSCQAKVKEAGEIVIETHERKDPRPDEEKRHEEFRKEFDALPLGKKVEKLMELEAVTLSETLNFVLNSPYAIGGAVVDFLSKFGLQFDKETKEARRPEEHRENGSTAETVVEKDEIIEAEERREEAGKDEKIETEKTDT
jgi:ferredoxin